MLIYFNANAFTAAAIYEEVFLIIVNIGQKPMPDVKH